jgi:16S rRNA (guanine1207-N2)-methyltransferase
VSEAVYGEPPLELAAPGAGAVQVSPLILGAATLESLGDASLRRFVVAAPPGTLERRHVLAHALRALAPGGELLALAPKTKGGARLAADIEAFGCVATDTGRRHHRICVGPRPAAVTGLETAIIAGGPQLPPALGLWSQPGVFSWDRIDPGSERLIEAMGALAGRGADLGCGVGVLSVAALRQPAVTEMTLLDIDRRAVEAASRNVDDPRARCVQADVLAHDITGLDFVIMNPPFHEGGRERRDLGAGFIAAAARALRRGGRLLMVANLALPYEAPLAAAFRSVETLSRAGGYKIYRAIL